MRSRRRNRLSYLVLVCYTLSLTASGWFHDHHHGACVDSGRLCTSHASCATEADHSAPVSGRADQPAATASSSTNELGVVDDGHCLVCQFLAQRTLGDLLVTEVACATLVEQVALPEPSLIAHSLVACCQIRAPPSAA